VRLKPPEIETEAQVRSGIRYFLKPTDELWHLLRQAEKAKVISIDIETSTLRPYKGGKILTIAISFDDKNFSFPWDHPKVQHTEDDFHQLHLFMLDLLAGGVIKIAHNAPFECEWFVSEFGPEVIVHDTWEDTMMQASILDERRGGMGLDFLIKQYFGLAYKSLFKLDKKDMAKSDLTETLIYNAVDTKYTLRLWHHQNKLLKEEKLYEAYKMARLRQPTVAIMQYLGMETDQDVIKKFKIRAEAEIEDLSRTISDLDVVRSYVRDRGSFNPMGEDAVIIFRDYLKRKEIEVRDGAALRWSVDKNVLEKINHPLAEAIVELRHVSKLKSTYIDGLELGNPDGVVYPDGKLHTSFNTCFTETGRTSSDGPNMQNFPQRRDSWVRQQVVPPSDHYIVAFDYGQLEACTAAMCSRDKYLVKALWDDYDIHMEFAGKMAKEFPDLCPDFRDPKATKGFRSLIKNKMVFPAVFGAQPDSIAGYLGLEKGSLDKFMEREFWRVFSGLYSWQEETMKGYYKDGYVASPLGRRRRYPLKREQAINHPIQCLAAEIVCDAMCRLSKMAVETGKMYLHPRLNIHDDITVVIPRDPKILDSAIETIYRELLTPPWKELVNVPLSVKAEMGTNWGELHEVGKFWSHKDIK
jgi:DNA polymerase-1